MSFKTTLSQQKDGLYARLQMNSGDILCQLEFERSPIAVASFVGLAEGRFDAPNAIVGHPYFDGLTFHRVEPGFVVQGGDPDGNGMGGPGYEFPDEIHRDLKHSKAGILSMANAGPDTNGSQFFITLAEAPFLDGSYTVFGAIVAGLDVVQKVQKGAVIKRLSIHRKGQKANNFVPSWEDFQAMVAAKNQSRLAEQAGARQSVLDYIQQTWPTGELQNSSEGLQYKIVRQGQGQSGRKAAAKQYTVHYTLWLADDPLAKIDSSRDRGKPLTIVPEQVIRGWGLSLPNMKQGEQRVVLVPGELGYGKRGHPPIIPPDSYLLFEMEIIRFS